MGGSATTTVLKLQAQISLHVVNQIYLFFQVNLIYFYVTVTDNRLKINFLVYRSLLLQAITFSTFFCKISHKKTRRFVHGSYCRHVDLKVELRRYLSPSSTVFFS